MTAAASHWPGLGGLVSDMSRAAAAADATRPELGRSALEMLARATEAVCVQAPSANADDVAKRSADPDQRPPRGWRVRPLMFDPVTDRYTVVPTADIGGGALPLANAIVPVATATAGLMHVETTCIHCGTIRESHACTSRR